MADAYLGLADLVKINDKNNAERDISDLLDQAPLLKVLPGDTCPDTTHKYLKQTSAPVVGFRAVDAGLENKKSGDTQITVTLAILDATWVVDQAVPRGCGKGEAWYMARESARHLKQAFFVTEKQFLYGTVHGDAAGCEGLANSALLNHTNGAMVVNAAGAAAGTGSSVWAVRATPDLNGVVAIVGQSGKITIDNVASIMKDDESGKHYPAYMTPILGWLCLQIGGAYSVGRLCNLTAESGKTLTDDMLSDLISKFKASEKPTHFAMSRRSLSQLQKSRTATNATGAPAPFPTESFGVPIVCSDAVLDTETILTAGT